MSDVCGSKTIIEYGTLLGTVGMQSDLACQQRPGHEGFHSVDRWFGHVLMTAKWA